MQIFRLINNYTTTHLHRLRSASTGEKKEELNKNFFRFWQSQCALFIKPQYGWIIIVRACVLCLGDTKIINKNIFDRRRLYLLCFHLSSINNNGVAILYIPLCKKIELSFVGTLFCWRLWFQIIQTAYGCLVIWFDGTIESRIEIKSPRCGGGRGTFEPEVIDMTC